MAWSSTHALHEKLTFPQQSTHHKCLPNGTKQKTDKKYRNCCRPIKKNSERHTPSYGITCRTEAPKMPRLE